MSRATILAATVAAFAFAPVYAQDNKDWCTDSHMKEMDQKVAAMTDEAKKKEASMHLQQSKDAMNKDDTAGCIEHMKQAHTAMGM